ncbi:MAG: cytochrome C552, partial [Acetobacteraceae bacterium]|nr:cytochrome C552 [Acetobacteraceae bacterium]
MPRSALPFLLLPALFWPGPAARGQDLPQGPGRDAVQAACTGCHDLGQVTRSGHSREGWRAVLQMMAHAGAKVPP